MVGSELPEQDRNTHNHPIRKGVVLASRTFRPEANAAALRLGALHDGLRKRSIPTRVLTTRSPIERSSTDEIIRWPVLRDRGGNVRGYIQYLSFDIPLFFRLLFTRNIGVIVSEPPPTTGMVVKIIARLRRKPYVYFAADVWSTATAGVGTNSIVVRILRAVEKAVLRGAARILSVSAGVSEEIEKTFAMSSEKIVTVGTGVDLGQFNLGESEERIHPTQPTFVYAGTMSEFQGAEVFIDAFRELIAQYPEAKLIMYGQGTAVETMKLEAVDLPAGSVEFPGLVPPRVIADALRSATAGLASMRPDIGYDFALPTKVFTVLGCGTPILYAGPLSIATEIASQRLGIVTAWNADEIAQAMLSIARGQVSLVDATTRYQWVAERYSLEAVGERAAVAIEEVLRS